jgi:hypothetical protein
MKTVLDMPNADVITTTPSSEVRKAALGRAVTDLTAQGRRVAKPDYQAVLVGHDDFRVALVRRQWGIRDHLELVEVDEQGNLSIREV